MVQGLLASKRTASKVLEFIRFSSAFYSLHWLIPFCCRFMFSLIAERENRDALVVKVTGESSESSTSLTVIKSVQNVVSASAIILLS